MTPAHGLVIGKFYPPHAGHRLLIDTAAQVCRRVSVVVMAASHESIPLAQRVAWLRAIHAHQPGVAVAGVMDDVRVDYADATVWDAHVALMRQALATIGAGRVDAVFTSEPYGTELARRFGARAVTLDVGRLLAPVSATQVRADVAGRWLQLEPPVRADLALRVVVVGAESTGTTTLSLDLAHELRTLGGAHGLTRWVAEYGRAYSQHKLAVARAQAQLDGRPDPGLALPWTPDEFLHIARTQVAWQAGQAALGGPVLVCDTDAFATAIWHERYLGQPHAGVEEVAEASRGHLYLLTHHEGIAFEQDGLRDGEAIRPWMTARFQQALHQTGRPCRVLHGDRATRCRLALDAVRELLRQSWRFAPPLG